MTDPAPMEESAFRRLVRQEISVSEYINDIERRVEELEAQQTLDVLQRAERVRQRLARRFL